MMSNTSQEAKSSSSGSRRSGLSSYAWAILIALGIGGWLWTGQIAPAAPETENATAEASKPADAGLFKVSTRVLEAEQRPARLVIRGQTKSPARVHVRAETNGVVASITDKKGQLVNAGDLLCKLKVDARQAALTEARAALEQTRADYNSSSKLTRSGFTAKNRKMADKARLDAAKAALTRAELDMDRITVNAPFRGVIEAQPAKPGDYLRQADICATVVKIDPILLVGSVSERDLAKVKNGMTVQGRLVTGERVDGKITFISPVSDVTTRTFMFEASVPNADMTIRAGVTTDIMIDLDTEKAHRVAASTLSLDENGQVGLKIVDANDQVRFVPVTILSNEKDALWVSGLPQSTKIITVGQEYVVEGQKVQAVPELSLNQSKTMPTPKPAATSGSATETRTSDQPRPPKRKPKA